MLWILLSFSRTACFWISTSLSTTFSLSLLESTWKNPAALVLYPKSIPQYVGRFGLYLSFLVCTVRSYGKTLPLNDVNCARNSCSYVSLVKVFFSSSMSSLKYGDSVDGCCQDSQPGNSSDLPRCQRSYIQLYPFLLIDPEGSTFGSSGEQRPALSIG